MKITEIQIENYRSLSNIAIYPSDILALVGRNNSGKSNVMKAIELFFSNSSKLIDDECFHNHHLDRPIKILISFDRLNDQEKSVAESFLIDNKLILGKQIARQDNGSYEINYISIINTPQCEWLQDNIITGAKINEWWSNRESLRINSLNFCDYLGSSKPNVAAWREKAREFVDDHKSEIRFIKSEIIIKNLPKNLIAVLPEFIYIPAVRDITDEAKVLKSNPFGQLINSVIDRIPGDERGAIDRKIAQIEKKLNRDGKTRRISELRIMEDKLNKLMCELMDCDIEIKISMPKLRNIFIDAKLYVDDGVITPVEVKGHGLQRAMIFTIMRAYSDFTDEHNIQNGLDSRSTIFAIEEPEIYLHPQFQRTLMAIFRKISLGNDQIFYTTQSNIFLDIQYFDQICIMRREKKDGIYCSSPTQLAMSAMINDLRIRKNIVADERGMREQYSNAFNPMVNEGFFGDKVVIVEGPSEQYSLPIYADIMKYNFDRNNISIVYSDGKGQMDRLLRVFNGFKIPTYLWFDGDKDTTDAGNREKTLELLELLGDPVSDVSEIRTKITDKYAILEFNYEEIIEKEVAECNRIKREAKTVIGPCGKPLTHRYIANKLKQEATVSLSNTTPKTIKKIINKVKKLSYTSCILRS